MANLHLAEESPPSTPTPSNTTTLNLSGSLQGDTIQVEGDTGSLQFSLQFNIHSKYKHVTEDQFSSLRGNCFENNHTFENAVSASSSYMTTNNTNRVEVEDQNAQPETGQLTVENNGIVETGEPNTGNSANILTRLRSGAISPVKYFPRISAMSCESLKRKLKFGRKRDLLKTVLRRHSLPVRPCNSYAFFVMDNWGSVKNPSFCEASKTLGKMWCQLSNKEKKVFIDMALKDSARYRRQCTLLQGTGKRTRERGGKQNRRSN